MLSHQLLHTTDGRLVYRGWRRRTWGRVPRTAEATLLSLSQPRGDTADLLTPLTGTLGLDAGLESLRATPAQRIRRDLAHLATRSRLPGWTRRLADGDPDALAALQDRLK